ncbi:MAG: hypothetical protein WBD36_13180 [Bacteroidota bacterium]
MRWVFTGMLVSGAERAAALPDDSLKSTSQAKELYEYLWSIGDEPMNALMLYKMVLGQLPKNDEELEQFIESRDLPVDRTFWRYSTVWTKGDTCVVRVLIDEFSHSQFRLDDGAEIVTALALFYLRSAVPGTGSSAILVSGELFEGRLRMGSAVRGLVRYQDNSGTVMRLSEADRKRLLGQTE